jgi:hypothetical protein
MVEAPKPVDENGGGKDNRRAQLIVVSAGGRKYWTRIVVEGWRVKWLAGRLEGPKSFSPH